MNYHQESTFIDSHSAVLSSLPPSSNGFGLLSLASITVVTCLALTVLDIWPSTIKRTLWETFVYLIPSQFIYAMEFLSRRRQQGGQGNLNFRQGAFGNQQAKSEALQRVFGFGDSLALVVQQTRRLSGLDHVLGSPKTTPAGLGNWDNSCYQNSVIQSLASLSCFDEYLAQNVGRMSQDDKRSTHDALRNIIGRLNYLDNEGKRLWTPSALKSMSSWQQQDAQEYLSRIIDEVDNEISRVAKETSIELGVRLEGDDGRLPRIWQHNPLQGLLAQRVSCTRCGYSEGLSLLPFTCLTVNLGMQWEYDVRDCLDEYTALESIEGVECIKCSVLRTKTSLEQLFSNMDIHDASKPHIQPHSAHVSTLSNTVTHRLQVLKEVCEAGDFSDISLYKKCNIPVKSRVSSTKSKQAILARSPQDLVIHVNRSIFDATGLQRKNYARVRFPLELNLNKWSLGSNCVKTGPELSEYWNTSPTESMLPKAGAEQLEAGKLYKLRAVITHSGGHENGHYIAYRKRHSNIEVHDTASTDAKKPDETWFRFSDDVVSPVSEDHVLSQGGVFMLFYEGTKELGNTVCIPAQAVANETTISQQQAIQVASCEENGARIETKEILEANHTDFQPAQSAHGVVLSSDVDSPPKSSLAAEDPALLEGPNTHPKADVQLDPARPSSVAPVMRTAGTLSPSSRTGRRSSNISMHSPSFVTAS